MSCSGASMNASGASLFTKRPTSRGGGSITGKIGAGSSNKAGRRSQKFSNKRRTKPPSANITDSVSSVATLLQHTTMFPSKQLRPTSSATTTITTTRQQQQQQQQQQRTVLSRRENILNVRAGTTASSNKTTSSSLSCSRSSQQPASRIRELHAGGWGGRGAGGIKDGFVNIKVKDLRTGRSCRIAEYCRDKVCVIDFWMSRSGGSRYVSMDA